MVRRVGRLRVGGALAGRWGCVVVGFRWGSFVFGLLNAWEGCHGYGFRRMFPEGVYLRRV